MSNKDFGDWLKAQIKSHGKTQAEFAVLIGIEQPQLSRIINGSRGTSTQVLVKIASLLKIPVDTILQKAGYISQKMSKSERVERINHLLNMLDEDDLQDLEDLARAKLDRRKKTETPETKTSRGKKPARSALIAS